MNYKYLKDFLILAGVILLAAIGARVLSSGETLDDYAQKHPEKAQTIEQQTTESVSVVPSEENDILKQNTSSGTDNANESNNDDTRYITDIETAPITQNDNTAVTTNNDEINYNSEEAKSPATPDRITYMDDFYYEPIPNDIFQKISGISYPEDCTVPLDELRYVVVKYVDFDGESKTGELICNKEIAQDLVEIFYDLYQADYRIESIRLVDEFGGDDIKSMQANNTSCFNYRVIAGTTKLSNHSYGKAIDLNPFYNPYITYKKDGTIKVSPEGSEAYADRSAAFPYKIDENDLAYKLFIAHGFKWGGNWNSSKDYQHFER